MADNTTIIVAGVLIGFVVIVGAILVYRCVFASKRSEDEQGVNHALLHHAQQTPAGSRSASTVGTKSTGSNVTPSPMPKGKYSVQRKLGDGTYGVVFLAIRNSDNRQVAVKIITCNDAKASEDAIQEFKLCQALQGHPNVIQLLDVFEDVPSGRPSRFGAVQLKDLGVSLPGGFAKALCIVTEFFADGTLFDLLSRRNNGLPEDHVWSFTEQMLSALNFIHRNNVIHRDIKPSNILISKANGAGATQRLVLTDFGLSREFDPDQYVHTKIGTFHYMAPEQVQRRYTAKADVWGVGCMIHAMCTAKVASKDAPVMFEHRKKPTFEENFRKDFATRGYSVDLANFALQLLCENYSNRPSAEEALVTLQSAVARRRSGGSNA